MHSYSFQREEELLAAIPAMLAHQPMESLVMVSLRGQRMRNGLLARIDIDDILAEVKEHPPEIASDTPPEIQGHVLSQLARDGAEELFVALYTSDVLAYAPGLNRWLGQLQEHIPIRSIWLHTGSEYGRFKQQPGPDHGEIITLASLQHTRFKPAENLKSTQIYQNADERGLHIHEDLEDLYQPDILSTPANTECGYRCESPVDYISHFQTWRRFLEHRDSPADTDRILCTITDVHFRDAIVHMWVNPECEFSADFNPLSAEWGMQLAESMDVLLQINVAQPPQEQMFQRNYQALIVLRRAAYSAHQVAAITTLLSMLTWWRGLSAQSAHWLSCALQIDPGYSLAHLMQSLLSSRRLPAWMEAPLNL